MVENTIKFDNYTLHIIKNSNFKNVDVRLFFMNEYDQDEAPVRNILFKYLAEGGINHTDQLEYNRYLERNYNAQVNSYTERYGKTIVSCLYSYFLSPSIVEDENYANDIISLLFDLVFKPNIKDKKFDNTILDIVKNRIITAKKTRKENSQNVAIGTAFKIFSKTSISSLSLSGSIKRIRNITDEELYDVYKKIIKDDKIEIYLAGNISDDLIDLIKNKAKFKNENNLEPNYIVYNEPCKKIKEKSKKRKQDQSHLVYICNMTNLNDYERKYVAKLYAGILGGNAGSILFDVIREKNSLCYSIFADYMMDDQLLLIHTGIDKKNASKAKELINDILSNYDKYVSQELLNRALTRAYSSLSSIEDSLCDIIYTNFHYDINYLDSLPEKLEKYKNVSLEEVINLSKKVKINTVFFLEGEASEKD